MRYSQLLSRVNKATVGEISRSCNCYGHLVQEDCGGFVLVDRVATSFGSLEEAIDSIKQRKLREDLEQEIQQEQYATISENKIVNIIKQHHSDVRITDTLVESYVELASSKSFTIDPVALGIRNLNKLDRIVESRVDFVLDDGSVVAITEETHQKLNNIFAHHQDVVEYMKTSKDNFLDVLNQLEE